MIFSPPFFNLMNRLSNEKSAYLKHSAYQKIDWYPWSEEAFEKAKTEDKPVFLSTGAVWCHWCHVMAKECFENEDVVKLLNENFICIKLDRDERPDIDRRFQHAVAAMGSSTGWPLSVFLTPNKTPFFGGTYFPPEDIHGRHGFKKVLKAVSELYRSKKNEVYEYSNKLMNLLKTEQLSKGGISETMLNNAVEKMISQYDPQNGGFGSAPKFPMPGAIEFLTNRYFFDQKKSIAITVKKTLEAMAKGGFHDQLGGGFHRYSTDESWIIPHFEKMADDNAWLLRNYINAYLLFKDEYFRDTAKDIIDFLKSEFSNPDGGFYASQDADITPDDEGGYFTWEEQNFRKVLNAMEFKVLSLHLLHDRGSMHHDTSKKVLFIAKEPDDIAKEAGINHERVLEIIAGAKAKLIAERRKRESPFIDTTLYTSLNCMFISSYFLAYRIFKDDYLKEFGLLTLKKIMEKNLVGKELYHSEGVKAVIDDYVNLVDALISAYEVTEDKSFIDKSDELMQICLERFWDKGQGGFFDTSEEVLGIRLKGIEDIPHPSANSVGIMQLIRLFNHTGRYEHLQHAETALRAFSTNAKDIGIHSGYYFCALDAYFNMLKLTFHVPKNSLLGDAVLSSFSPYTSIVYEEDRGYVLPCIRTECYDPITTEENFSGFLQQRKKPN